MENKVECDNDSDLREINNPSLIFAVIVIMSNGSKRADGQFNSNWLPYQANNSKTKL